MFDPEKAYDKVAAIGVKWVRIQSGWARTEKEKGVYDFAWLDSIVDNLLARGLQPWMCLCYGNGLYDENAAKIFGAVGVPPIFTDEQRAAWDAYVRATVAHYKGRITHYEVWNEPDGKWAHYLQRLIRECDPYLLKTFLTNAAYEGGFRGFQQAQKTPKSMAATFPGLS